MVTNTERFIGSLGLFVVFCIILSIPKVKYIPICLTSIREVATRDLSVVGHYDMYLYNSLRNRCIVLWKRFLTYTDYTPTEISNLFIDWLKSETFDPERRIEGIILAVNADFLALNTEELDKIRAVHYSSDLPNLSKILRYNDYLNAEALDNIYYNTIQ